MDSKIFANFKDKDRHQVNDENDFNVSNNLIHNRNLIIGRIVYQCYHCIEVFNTLIDLNNHFVQFHTNVNNNDVIEDSIESNCKLLTENNCLTNYVNNNTIDANTHQILLNPMSRTKLRNKFIDFQVFNDSRVCSKVDRNDGIVDNCSQSLKNSRIKSITKKVKTKIKVKSEKKGLTERKERFGCDICGKSYKRFDDMNDHKKIHTNPKRCDFPDCEKIFATNSQLKRHRVIHFDEKQFKCTYTGCQFEAKQISGLRNHKLIHSENRPTFACDWPGCEFVFTNSGNLKQHKSFVHENCRPFKCDWPQCNESFKRHHCLESHIALQHKNERNFVCDFENCGKRFAINSHLQSHKRSHSAEKKFACDWPNCDRKFLHNYMLKKHLVIHTGERPYHCNWPACQAKFGLKVTLDTHKKLVHKCDYIRRSRWDKDKR